MTFTVTLRSFPAVTDAVCSGKGQVFEPTQAPRK